MKNLGQIEDLEPVKGYKANRALQRKLEDQDYFTFEFRVDVQDILDAVHGHNPPIEGLNAKADEIWQGFAPEVMGSISDISYTFRYDAKLPKGVVLINVHCSPAELEWPNEDYYEEKQRRDEKNGLYPDKDDPAN